MKYRGTMLVVKDIERTKEFYTAILGVRVISDLGENVTFTGGISAQTESSWMQFTKCDASFFNYQGNVVELYFEEEDFDGFMKKLNAMNVSIIGEASTMPWGQNVIRFYDPDKHIIEVGEDLAVMMKRLHAEGLTVDQLAEKTFMKKGRIERMLKK
ncbi:VOC family protein [Enterococcus sp. ALS3]|uniref:VOC family protein n=1 Tax=Enterococcus alishanensis TaxID=1303817 RepID=A0ABS6TH72_9ENTE|nr:VOC family protein [Enterococcus alishanensis]MBV7392218.1 VOC family protein [Enterococcus alishanensis]